MLPRDSLGPMAVVSPEWSVEASNSPHPESFISPEVVIETLQPAAGKSLKATLSVIGYGASNHRALTFPSSL